MNQALKVFILCWSVLFLLVNAAAVAGMVLTADSFWAGLTRLQDTYSPFNIINWALEILLLAPALGAGYWLSRRQ